MKDRSDDSSHHERTLLQRSYISLPHLIPIRVKQIKISFIYIYIMPHLEELQIKMFIKVEFIMNVKCVFLGSRPKHKSIHIWFLSKLYLDLNVHWYDFNRLFYCWAARCSSVVRAFAHGAMGGLIDPSWWTHWAISRSNQCSMTGVSKVVVCGMMHIKEPFLLIGKSNPCGGSGFPLSLSEWFFTICLTPYNCK